MAFYFFPMLCSMPIVYMMMAHTQQQQYRLARARGCITLARYATPVRCATPSCVDCAYPASGHTMQAGHAQARHMTLHKPQPADKCVQRNPKVLPVEPHCHAQGSLQT